MWPLNELRQWAENALATVRQLRQTFLEPGDLVWRAKAAEAFEQNSLAGPKLFAELRSRPASKHLKQIDEPSDPPLGHLPTCRCFGTHETGANPSETKRVETNWMKIVISFGPPTLESGCSGHSVADNC